MPQPRPILEPIASVWTAALFDGPFFESPSRDPALPAINTVFVQSADRNTGTRNPAGLGGGETDTHLIYEGLSRVRADAVLTGATTIRGSQTIFGVWHPELARLREQFALPRYPAQIVATLQRPAGIESELLFNVPEVRVFILTTAADDRQTARRATAMDHRPGRVRAHRLADARKRCARTMARRISCIGGRRWRRLDRRGTGAGPRTLTTSPAPAASPARRSTGGPDGFARINDHKRRPWIAC